MFLLDDLIMAPGKAMYVVFEQLAKKARDEWLDDEGVKRELQDLYAMVESGSISDREFESRECRLLERLQQIAAMKFQERWGSDASAPAPAQAPEQPEVSTRKSMPILDDVLTPLLSLPAAEPEPQPPVAVSERPRTAPATFERQSERPPTAPATFERQSERPRTASATFERQSVPAIAQLSISQVIDSALRALSVLNMKMSSVTSVTRDDEGWRVTVELVERRSVPDTSDLLGIYELHLDEGGNLLRYERTRMRRRCDLNW